MSLFSVSLDSNVKRTVNSAIATRTKKETQGMFVLAFLLQLLRVWCPNLQNPRPGCTGLLVLLFHSWHHAADPAKSCIIAQLGDFSARQCGKLPNKY